MKSILHKWNNRKDCRAWWVMFWWKIKNDSMMFCHNYDLFELLKWCWATYTARPRVTPPQATNCLLERIGGTWSAAGGGGSFPGSSVVTSPFRVTSYWGPEGSTMMVRRLCVTQQGHKVKLNDFFAIQGTLVFTSISLHCLYLLTNLKTSTFLFLKKKHATHNRSHQKCNP